MDADTGSRGSLNWTLTTQHSAEGGEGMEHLAPGGAIGCGVCLEFSTRQRIVIRDRWADMQLRVHLAEVLFKYQETG